jgi:glycosyltransferase involved in cell wall biosynthesis
MGVEAAVGETRFARRRIVLDVSAVPAAPVGAGVYTVELARGLGSRLVDSDLQLTLVTRRDDGDRWATIAPNAEIVAEAPTRRPARLVWEQTRAPELARRLLTTLWHGPHYTLPLRGDVPMIVTVHDLTFFDHPDWHERSKVAYFRRMIPRATQRAAAVICVSEATASRLAAVAPPRAPVFVIPHGVDHDRFTPEPDVDDRAALAAHGIREPFIGFVSTVEPRKNVPGLVRAFAQIADEHPDLQLVIGGSSGWGIDETLAAIAASGHATRIARPGRIADAALAAFYRRAAVVAYPSFEEGFGLPALEAMACGAPVVTSRGSALAEVVGDAALNASPGDDDELAQALRSALDPTIAGRLRRTGPERAHAFTWAASVDRHLSAYATVM